jgi:hypothetical protein
MEGFLEKKGSGESAFGRRNWKSRWFVLEGSTLFYYDDFDSAKGVPAALKGTHDVMGCEVTQISHHDRQHVFIVSSPDKKVHQMSAPSEKVMNLWIKAIAHAISGKGFGINYGEHYQMLGLKEEDKPDLSTINRAYRKLALKMHPDKGGDVFQFKKLQDAFDALAEKLDDEAQEAQYDAVEFSLTIKKGGKGVGFGMVVVEDSKKGHVLVKKTLPSMQVVSLDKVAEGMVKPGDRLVSIGNDDSANWPLSRVNQRLNDFRVPINSIIVLKFVRKFLKPGVELDEGEEDGRGDVRDSIPASEPETTAPSPNQNGSPEGGRPVSNKHFYLDAPKDAEPTVGNGNEKEQTLEGDMSPSRPASRVVSSSEFSEGLASPRPEDIDAIIGKEIENKEVEALVKKKVAAVEALYIDHINKYVDHINELDDKRATIQREREAAEHAFMEEIDECKENVKELEKENADLKKQIEELKAAAAAT